MIENDFDAIRPYHKLELPAALKRIVSNPLFRQLMNYLFPDEQHEELIAKLLTSETTDDFQANFMLPVIRSIVNKTSVGITVSGIENLSPGRANVFIANHRDIILDSSLLALMMVEHGYRTSEITWGDNLIVSPFIEDIGKSNKMITVFREGTPKEMFRNSKRLSSYIRQSVTQQNQSVWIAQRKGRSKDGHDSTDVSVLKMLSLSGDKKINTTLSDLNIIPVTISYEWEPCDSMKVRELFLSEKQEYIKEESEDLRSIIGGVVSQKGHIQLHIGATMNESIKTLNPDIRVNDFLNEFASLLDNQIQANYQLWPSNYLAFDLLNSSDKYSSKYDDETKAIFEKRFNQTMDLTKGPYEKIRDLFLRLYANPVMNKENKLVKNTF